MTSPAGQRPIWSRFLDAGARPGDTEDEQLIKGRSPARPRLAGVLAGVIGLVALEPLIAQDDAPFGEGGPTLMMTSLGLATAVFALAFVAVRGRDEARGWSR